MYNIAIISGDGIGLEVMESAEYLLDKLDINFNFKYGEAGFECFNKNGTTLPEETIKIAKSSDATLFGASTSTPGQPSPIINLRKELDVYAKKIIFTVQKILVLTRVLPLTQRLPLPPLPQVLALPPFISDDDNLALKGRSLQYNPEGLPTKFSTRRFVCRGRVVYEISSRGKSMDRTQMGCCQGLGGGPWE